MFNRKITDKEFVDRVARIYWLLNAGARHRGPRNPQKQGPECPTSKTGAQGPCLGPKTRTRAKIRAVRAAIAPILRAAGPKRG